MFSRKEGEKLFRRVTLKYVSKYFKIYKDSQGLVDIFIQISFTALKKQDVRKDVLE